MRFLSLALLAALVVAGLWCSTQYVAATLHYHPDLGPPWIALGPTRLYRPWAWFAWNDRYGRFFPDVFRNASAISTLAALLGIGAVALASVARRSTAQGSIAHGSARWATRRELRKADRPAEQRRDLLRHPPGDWQDLVVAPPVLAPVPALAPSLTVSSVPVPSTFASAEAPPTSPTVTPTEPTPAPAAGVSIPSRGNRRLPL